MAQVNTILADGSLSGERMPRANALQFGAASGEAIQGLGSTMSRGVSQAEQLVALRKNLDANQWVGESIEQEKAYISKWMADPENNSRESFADDLLQLTKQRQAEYESKAPNYLARQSFRQAFSSFSNSRYESALHTAASTKVQNMVSSIQSQVNSAMEGYRSAREIPNVDANNEITNNLGNILKTIDVSFGKIAPGVATNLKKDAVTNAVYTTMDHSPDTARKLMDMGQLDGHTRKILSDQIQRAEETRNATDVATFEELRKNWITLVEEGKKRDKIDLRQYQSIYSRDNAVAQKAKDDAIIDIYTNVDDFMTKVTPWSPGEQIKALNDFRSKIGDDPNTAFRDQRVYEIASAKIQKNIELAQKDPVAYMVGNNPALNQMYRQLSKMDRTTESYKSGLANMYDAIVRYQGSPQSTEGLDPSLKVMDDSKMYMNLPRTSVSILSVAEAENYAAQINHGSPKDALKAIEQVLQTYPEKYKAMAFNDMVKLPGNKGIRGEYWAAALNKNAVWIDDYLGTIQNAEAIKKSSMSAEKDFENALNGNATWLQFQNPMASDNFQRQVVMDDFRSGIMLYAMGLAQKNGLSPKKAVDLASQRLLNEELSVIPVNGKPTMIPRDQGPGKPLRTDVEIEDIGRRLSMSLQYIDPSEIKLQDEFGRSLFPSLNMAGTDETKRTAIRDAILANGTFQTTPDGKAAVLYYDDGMNHFELRDKNNRALVVNFEDLPKFAVHTDWLGFSMNKWTEGPDGKRITADPMAPIVTTTTKELSRGTNYLGVVVTMGSTIFHTNWPTMPTFIKREERK